MQKEVIIKKENSTNATKSLSIALKSCFNSCRALRNFRAMGLIFHAITEETFIIYILFSLEGQAVFTRLCSAGSWGPPINTPSVSANEGHSGCSVLPLLRTHTHTNGRLSILARAFTGLVLRCPFTLIITTNPDSYLNPSNQIWTHRQVFEAPHLSPAFVCALCAAARKVPACVQQVVQHKQRNKPSSWGVCVFKNKIKTSDGDVLVWFVF